MATKQEEEQMECSDSDNDEKSYDDVEVNIALIGKAGSGRSSCVNAILGVEDKNAAISPNGKETSCYSHPKNPNIKFSILPNIDQETFPAFKQYIDYANDEKFDAFIILTAKTFERRHLVLANIIKSNNKPFFFVRTEVNIVNNLKGGEQEFEDETALKELRGSFAGNLKEFHSDGSDIYLINNHHPDKLDFPKLTEAIEDALPREKACFSRIQKLNALETFQNFLQEVKSQIDTPDLDEIKNLLEKSGIAGVQRLMNEKLRQWKEIKINLAILGSSGAGKSSFINAIRGLKDDAKGAAMTGVTETTRVPTCFYYPTNPNVLFWDLPGIGTPNYPDLPSFCEKVGIERFDTFLILSSDRFTENDRLLAEKVQSMGKSFFFVRSKIDENKRAEKRKKKFDENKMLEVIRNNCLECFKPLNVGAENIFLISSHEPTEWDFNRLKEAISDRLPPKQKESLMLTLHANSKQALEEKIKLLKGKIFMVSAASISKKIGFWPFPKFVDQNRIRREILSYSSLLEFPTQDSEEFKMLSEDLQQRIRKFDVGSEQDFLQWLKTFDPDNTYKVKRYKKYIVTKKPLAFIQHSLNLIIGVMAKIAFTILEEAAKTAKNRNDSD